jgi:Na+-translocating ferredoxin:NAD+ oxidoreductase RnfD subunit
MTLRLPRDPRWLQLAFLGSFLGFGLWARDFPLWHAPLLFASGLTTQWLCGRWLQGRAAPVGGPAAGAALEGGWRSGSASALSTAITCLGLTLLLRTDRPWVPPLAAALAIGSKWLVRVRGRHLFNPAALGLCAVQLLTPHAWISPTQWGEGTAALLWFGALGLAVAHRAFRGSLSLAFLASWCALRAGRVLWLGQRSAVLWHQLAQPSLLLFAFFMVSDPKTTPRALPARLCWAALVAVTAFLLQHQAFVPVPLPWALCACAPLVPLFDLALAAESFANRKAVHSLNPLLPALGER